MGGRYSQENPGTGIYTAEYIQKFRALVKAIKEIEGYVALTFNHQYMWPGIKKMYLISKRPLLTYFSIPDFDVPFRVTGTGMTNSIPNFREQER